MEDPIASELDFTDEYDNILETPAIDVILETLERVIPQLPRSACIAIDAACLTSPYNVALIDEGSQRLYELIRKCSLQTCVLSWLPASPENTTTEVNRLLAMGIDAPVLLRELELPKKTLAWNAAQASYTRSRAENVAMYVGRLWVDVLPATTVTLPSTSITNHLLCRHIGSNIWSLRLSPSLK